MAKLPLDTQSDEIVQCDIHLGNSAAKWRREGAPIQSPMHSAPIFGMRDAALKRETARHSTAKRLSEWRCCAVSIEEKTAV